MVPWHIGDVGFLLDLFEDGESVFAPMMPLGVRGRLSCSAGLFWAVPKDVSKRCTIP